MVYLWGWTCDNLGEEVAISISFDSWKEAFRCCCDDDALPLPLRVSGGGGTLVCPCKAVASP